MIDLDSANNPYLSTYSIIDYLNEVDDEEIMELIEKAELRIYPTYLHYKGHSPITDKFILNRILGIYKKSIRNNKLLKIRGL